MLLPKERGSALKRYPLLTAGPVSRVLSIPRFPQIVVYLKKLRNEAIIYLERGLLRALKRPYPTGHPMCTDRSEQLLVLRRGRFRGLAQDHPERSQRMVPVLFGLAPRRDYLVSPPRFYARDSSLWLCPRTTGPGWSGLCPESEILDGWAFQEKRPNLKNPDLSSPFDGRQLAATLLHGARTFLQICEADLMLRQR